MGLNVTFLSICYGDIKHIVAFYVTCWSCNWNMVLEVKTLCEVTSVSHNWIPFKVSSLSVFYTTTDASTQFVLHHLCAQGHGGHKWGLVRHIVGTLLSWGSRKWLCHRPRKPGLKLIVQCSKVFNSAEAHSGHGSCAAVLILWSKVIFCEENMVNNKCQNWINKNTSK